MAPGPASRNAQPERLKLRAEDAEDLGVLSACLQDAVTRRADMAFQKRQRRFAMLLNRYRWEKDGGERVRAGLHIDNVLRAETIGFDALRADAVLSLLAIGAEPLAEEKWRLTLVFAGGPLLRLEVECIDASLDDIGSAWMTPRHPEHEDETADGEDGK